MKSVKHYIWKKNLMPKDLCQRLIKEIQKQEWKKHFWYDPGNEGYLSLKSQEPEVTASSEAHQALLRPYILKAIAEYQTLHHPDTIEKEVQLPKSWIRFYSRPRFNRYKKGSLLRPHVDHIHDIFDGTHKGIPLVSISGQLNDNFEGAEFQIQKQTIPMKQGDLLLFPSNFVYPHKVTRCLKGIRYSFICWGF